MKASHIAAIPLSALAIAACGGASAGPAPPPAVEAGGPASASLSDLQSSFTTVISRVTPEVVQISTPQGLGSGIVFDAKGDIVTNAHVVAGGGPLEVTDADGRTHHATLVGSFTPDDLAVVHAGAALPAQELLSRSSIDRLLPPGASQERQGRQAG